MTLLPTLLLTLVCAATASLPDLLGDTTRLDHFFQHHWSQSPLLIHNSRARPGPSRAAWVRTYRSLLGPFAVDDLLRANVSAFAPPPATLHYPHDVFLERPELHPDGVLVHPHPSPPPPSLPNLRDAVRAGYSLRIARLHYRSRAAAALTASLAALFGVPAGADIVLAPRTPHPAIHLHAHDTFLLQLHGATRVELFRTAVALPYPHMEHAPTTQQLGDPTATYTLGEGDVLYVPRGAPYKTAAAAAAAASDDDISVRVALEVRSAAVTFRDAMERAVDAAARAAGRDPEDNILVREVLDDDDVTWRDVVKACVRVLADVTDEMRKVYAWTAPMSEHLGDGKAELQRRVRAFVDAGAEESETVLRGVLEVLAEEAEADLYAGRDFQRWAVRMLNAGDEAVRAMRWPFYEALQAWRDHLDIQSIHDDIVGEYAEVGDIVPEMEQSVAAHEDALRRISLARSASVDDSELEEDDRTDL